jgi:hypothetical protein
LRLAIDARFLRAAVMERWRVKGSGVAAAANDGVMHWR